MILGSGGSNEAAVTAVGVGRYVAAPPALVSYGLKRSQMSKRPSQPWSSEDEARLRALAAAGRSTATIAERLKRPPAAIRYKAMRLNIVIYRVSPKRAKPQEKNKEKIPPPPNRLNP
jgi:hypothetical protein